MKVLFAIIMVALLLDCTSLPFFTSMEWPFFYGDSVFSAIGEGIIATVISLFVFGLIFFVIFSVLGSVIIAVSLGLLTLLITGLSLFWPVLLIVVALTLFNKRNSHAVE